MTSTLYRVSKKGQFGCDTKQFHTQNAELPSSKYQGICRREGDEESNPLQVRFSGLFPTKNYGIVLYSVFLDGGETEGLQNIVNKTDTDPSIEKAPT